MTVYIEQVVIDNLAVNLAVILATLKALRLSVKRLRLLFAALLGTAFAVAFPFIKSYAAVYKLICAALMVALFGMGKGVRGYVLTFITFVGFSFLLGGVVFGLHYFPIDANGSFSLPQSGILGLTVMGVLFTYYVLNAVKCAYTARTHTHEQTLDVSFKNGNKAFCGLAGVDTGNNLYDNLTGKPVIILSKGLIELKGGERLIRLNTVSGSAELPLVALKEFKIGERDVGTVLAAVTDRYDGKIILHTDLLKEGI